MNGTALLIPGTLCDATLFDAVTARLETSRVELADLTGHRSVETAAQALLEGSRGRLTCIGFSLGGFVALEMLRRDPSRVRAVALVSGNAHPDRPENAAARQAEVALSGKIGMDAYVRSRAAAWGLEAKPAVLEQVARMAVASGQRVHEQHAEMNIARPDLRDVVARTHIPVLVISGDEDTLCPPERYKAAAAGERGRCITLAGCGHWLPIEAPAAVAAALSEMECRP